eukprot:280255-Pleurochrysis_carterae.AAC.1
MNRLVFCLWQELFERALSPGFACISVSMLPIAGLFGTQARSAVKPCTRGGLVELSATCGKLLPIMKSE